MANEYSAQTGVAGVTSGLTYSISNLTFTFNSPEPMSTAMADSVRLIFNHLETLINVTFTETLSTTANITFHSNDIPNYSGYAYYPRSNNTSDVYIDEDFLNSNFDPGTGLFRLMAHEIGHAMGLIHPHEDGTNFSGNTTPSSAGPAILPLDEDSTNSTLLTYKNATSTSIGGATTTKGSSQAPTTFQIYDIAELQYQYGVNTSHNAGNDTYFIGEYDALTNTHNASNASITLRYTIWDGGGIDELNASHISGNHTIDLREGLQHVTRVGNTAHWIAYGANIENARGGIGHDTIDGNFLANSIFGGGGSDFIDGHGSNDTISGQEDHDNISGGDGDDRIYGDGGGDTLNGDAGNDIIGGGSGNDTINGGDGDDYLYGGSGYNSIDGGDGNDTVSYQWRNGNVEVRLSTGVTNNGAAGRDSLTNIENIIGTDFNDTLVGDYKDNIILGGDGNDFISGESGDDSLYGGNGNDTLSGQLGADTLDGGNGIDTANYSFSPSAINLNLQTNISTGGYAQGDRLFNIENIFGSQFNDTITGDASNNFVFARDGHDVVKGGRGNDTLSGENGNDALYGDSGNDTLSGGNDNDTLSGGSGDDTLNGDRGDDHIYGGAGADTIDGGTGTDLASYWGSSAGVTIDLVAGTGLGGDAQGDTLTNIENIGATIFNDHLTGDSANNIFFSGAGNDTIFGKAGDDRLYASDGADELVGGAGADILVGGNDADLFTFDLLTDSTLIDTDMIMDFTQGIDQIDLSGIGFFSSVADLTITQNGSITNVHWTRSDFSFDLQGNLALTDADFIFA